MEAVPADALLGAGTRQCIGLGHLGLGAVERRVEARDLGQVGPELPEGPDRGQVVRLVERCEVDEPLEIGQDPGVDRGRLAVFQSAVDDAVARRGQSLPAQTRLDLGGPAEHVFDRARVAQPGALGPLRLGDGGPGPIADAESGRREQPLRLAAEQRLEFTRTVDEDGELQARRAGVQDGDGPVHGDPRSGSWRIDKDGTRTTVRGDPAARPGTDRPGPPCPG